MGEPHIDPLAFRPLPIEELRRLVAPLRALLSPVSGGLEGVPREGPVLFTGNHTVFGLLDVPMLGLEIYERTGRAVRGLGDHFHFQVPGWGAFLRGLGAVPGTRENCAALFRAREPVLVFPGGGREVFKRKDEKYQLIWKERIGFARLAIDHEVPIVPFASVGVEDMFEIVSDAVDLMRSPVGDLLRFLGITEKEWFRNGEMIPPLTRGKGIASLPRIERQYFLFGKPIDTTRFERRGHDRDACFALRKEVQIAIEMQISRLREVRSLDPERYPIQRLLRRLAARLG
jgi:1-acyl-sn-glycerol-3-phosphate acyltransferase